MTRSHYLTARCPIGCECWLHPAAVRTHLHPGRCRRHPWVDDAVETAAIPRELAGLLLEMMPARLVHGPKAVLPASVERALPVGIDQVTISSPLPEVAPRRWLGVVTAAVCSGGPDMILRAQSPDTYAALEAEFGRPEHLVACADCGWTLEPSGLARHRSANTRCRWIRAAVQVRLAWDQGWRDPFSLGRGTPLTWAELQRTVRWRNRIRVVRFPLWTAVLLSPTEY